MGAELRSLSRNKKADAETASALQRETVLDDQRTTRAPPPPKVFSTSLRVAIDVSPGVVEASAP